jgi:small subunit ribosomal protein S15
MTVHFLLESDEQKWYLVHFFIDATFSTISTSLLLKTGLNIEANTLCSDCFQKFIKKFNSLFDLLHKKTLFLRSKIGDLIYIWINNILVRNMYLTAEKKQEFFKTFGTSEIDTGNAEGQIALFSYRISHLTEHLKKNRKDFSTQQALIKLVGKRRRLLDYLKIRDIERYREIIKALKLRK